MPRVLIIIPARHASTRFPGKALTVLRGARGESKPLIAWVWEAGMRASAFAETVVATDDARIADTVAAIGGKAVMTSTAARNGTERCAEVIARMDPAPDFVINLQGDSPLVRRDDIASLIECWQATGQPVVTPYVTCTPEMIAAILAEEAAGRVGGTSLVADQEDRALYFSKRAIPFRGESALPLKLHIGLYGYTPDALRTYLRWDQTPLEISEGLEQLRFLERGMSIQTLEVPLFTHGFREVNYPEDVSAVERALAAQG